MSLRKKFSALEVEGIYSAANSAIWLSHNFANVRAKARVREEDYVATLVSDGIPQLEARWKALLAKKGISLRISGVFCHGHPQVKFAPAGKPVELADLLIVHQHIGKRRSFSRAVLIQAKMSIDASHLLPAGDRQLLLFSNWPDFEFVTRGLQPGVRNLRPNQQGSRYALVLAKHEYPENITWPDQCPWAASQSIRQLEGTQSFAKLLGNLLLHQEGRPVSLIKPRNDWSRTVKELLKVTGSRTYKRANISRGDTKRGTSSYEDIEGILLSYGDLHSPHGSPSARSSLLPLSERFFTPLPNAGKAEENIPPDANLLTQDADEPNGISTLVIESSDINGELS